MATGSMRRTSRWVLVAGVVMLLSGCVPPSGAGDARTYDLGVCGQFEVRLGGTDGGFAFLAVRKYGLTLNWSQPGSGSCRVFSLQIGTGPDAEHQTLTGCARSHGVDTCYSYPDPLGGTWHQVSSENGSLQSARIGLSDISEEIATRYIDVYP